MIDRYSRPELAALWSDGARYATWLDVELAVCEVMEHAGRVPAGTAATVRARAAAKLDPARIAAHEAITRHDVIAFLTHVEELAGEPARWLHLGMTSSDVLDSGLALQTLRALDVILASVDRLRAALAAQAHAHAATPMMGRSQRYGHNASNPRYQHLSALEFHFSASSAAFSITPIGALSPVQISNC